MISGYLEGYMCTYRLKISHCTTIFINTSLTTAVRKLCLNELFIAWCVLSSIAATDSLACRHASYNLSTVDIRRSVLPSTLIFVSLLYNDLEYIIDSCTSTKEYSFGFNCVFNEVLSLFRNSPVLWPSLGYQLKLKFCSLLTLMTQSKVLKTGFL